MVILATLLGALLTAAAPGPSEPAFTRACLTYAPDGDAGVVATSRVPLPRREAPAYLRSLSLGRRLQCVGLRYLA